MCVLLVQPVAAADPKVVYQQSTDALYNLDFSIAQRGYESLTREFPGNPDYWNALASCFWLKIIYDQQKLNMESFSGGSLGTKDSREAVNPADEKSLREALGSAINKANAILKKNPKDVRALYALGVSNATLAAFEGSAKRAYFEAHSKAKAAKNVHQQVLKLDPAFDDARLAIGAYDYVVGVIPGVLRFFLGIFGISSAGKESGIQQLETTAARGKNASTDAKMLLVVVYVREKRLDQALRLADELHTRYPRNFLFELSKASIYGKMKKWDDAVQVYEQVLAKVKARRDGYDRLREEKVYYEIGRANIDRLQFEKSLEAFKYVVAGKESTTDEKGNAYLWMGKIYDSKKDRTAALRQYDLLLGLNCDQDLKAEAQKYKRRPYVP